MPDRANITTPIRSEDKPALEAFAMSLGLTSAELMREALIEKMARAGWDPIQQLPKRGARWRSDPTGAAVSGKKGGRTSAANRWLRDKARPRRHRIDLDDLQDEQDRIDQAATDHTVEQELNQLANERKV